MAFFAVAPKRYIETGKLGLRFTHRGFGTPFFRGPDGADEQVRVEDGVLIHQVGDDVRAENLTTLHAATRFLGIEYREAWFEGFHDPLDPIDPTSPLQVVPTVTDAIGEWFGFATHVLERARRMPEAGDVSRVQLWPEHFDPAFEMGSQAARHRASLGASPGDDGDPTPYLYVAPWGEIDRSAPYWNAIGFPGAILGHEELLAAADPYLAAMDFFSEGRRTLVR